MSRAKRLIEAEFSKGGHGDKYLTGLDINQVYEELPSEVLNWFHKCKMDKKSFAEVRVQQMTDVRLTMYFTVGKEGRVDMSLGEHFVPPQGVRAIIHRFNSEPLDLQIAFELSGEMQAKYKKEMDQHSEQVPTAK